MEGQDIKGLMEAYSQVYETPEVLNEEVVEEDSEVLDEQGRTRNRPSPEQVAANRRGLANTLLYGNPKGRNNRVTTPRQRQRNRTSTQPTRPVANLPADYKKTELAAGAAAEKSRPGAGLPVSGGGNQGSNRPAPRPSAAPARDRMANASKEDRMAAWAKANPKLAAAKAERDRTRGTSASTNPLMKGMPGATLKKAQEAPKPQMSARAQALKAGGPAGGARERMLNQDLNIFDLVKGHLLDEGYAETEEGAMVIMVNMSEEWRRDILEFLGGQKGDGYLGHPRLGIKNPMAKKQSDTKTSSNTGLAGKLGNRAAALDAAMGK